LWYKCLVHLCTTARRRAKDNEEEDAGGGAGEEEEEGRLRALRCQVWFLGLDVLADVVVSLQLEECVGDFKDAAPRQEWSGRSSNEAWRLTQG
jgi:hypothetical protein